MRSAGCREYEGDRPVRIAQCAHGVSRDRASMARSMDCATRAARRPGRQRGCVETCPAGPFSSGIWRPSGESRTEESGRAASPRPLNFQQGHAWVAVDYFFFCFSLFSFLFFCFLSFFFFLVFCVFARARSKRRFRDRDRLQAEARRPRDPRRSMPATARTGALGRCVQCYCSKGSTAGLLAHPHTDPGRFDERRIIGTVRSDRGFACWGRLLRPHDPGGDEDAGSPRTKGANRLLLLAGRRPDMTGGARRSEACSRA